jgi:hypothetical protein
MAFARVCFVVLPRTLLAGEKIRIGGLALKTLKKLYGERLGLPSLSMVLAKAIGLGPIEPSKIPCICGVLNAEGKKLFMFLFLEVKVMKTAHLKMGDDDYRNFITHYDF